MTTAPGSGTLVGFASFVTTMLEGTSVRRTVAWAEAVAGLPSSSSARAVTMSVWLAPGTPVKVPVKLQGKLPPTSIVAGRTQVVAVMAPATAVMSP